VEALAFSTEEIGPVPLLIIAPLEARAGLHHGEDVDQAGVIPPLLEDLLDTVFFAERAGGTDILDLQAVLLRALFGVLTQLVPKGLGKLLLIEDADALGVEERLHAPGVANAREAAGNDDPVKASPRARELVGVAFGEQGHGRTSDEESYGREALPVRFPLAEPTPFGSGSAGLGETR
jgi:hypothetical protein